MQNINYSGQYYNNHNYNIKIRTGDDIANATGDAICGEFMIAKEGEYPGLYVATKTSGDDFEIYRVSEISSANKFFDNRYSLSFDGVDQYMSTDFGLTPNSYSAYSFGGWVYFNAFKSGAGPFNVPQAGWNSYTSNTFIRVDSATSILIYHTDDSTYRYTNVTYTLSLNTWHHFVQVWDGSDVKLYIDGALRGTLASVTSWGDFGNNVRFEAGRGRNAYYNCLVDEAIWFSSALSASDVTSIYNSGTPNDISSLNPVGWWRMGDSDGGTGTTITDQGSEGNDGTLVNGPTFSTNVPIFNIYSVQFDGTDDYMNASGTELDLKSNFSTSAWYKAPDPSSANGFLWFWGENSSGKRRSLMLVNGKFYINFHNPLESGPSSTSTLSANTWYHIVTTVNSDYSEAKVYVNGSLEDTVDLSSIASDYTTYSGTYLSVVPSIGQGVPNMLIDEFSIFNSVLSASDVTSIYNSGTPDDLSSYSPVGWWRMGDNNAGVGTTITDRGSGGNDGTLVNGPTFSTDVPS